MKKSKLFLGIAASLSFSAAGSAWAQEGNEAKTLETVIVTAQRRQQDLQDVPLAMSALSSEAIEKADIDSFRKMEGQVPGLKISTGTDRTNINIRGVGSTIPNAATEAGVPVNIDGVYMTRTTLSGAVYGDLRQIEVLRGPQGTLYGRNATGGTINIWTKLPSAEDEVNGTVSALAGNGGRYRVRGAVGFPISDTLSARIGASYEDVDGYTNNLFLDQKADFEEHSSAKVVVRWEPSEALELLLRASVSSDTVGNPIAQFRALNIPFPVSPLTPNPVNPIPGETSRDPRNINNDVQTSYDFDDTIIGLTAIYDMEWATLKSVTAYQEHEMSGFADLDGSSTPHSTSRTPEESSAWTQEITLSGGDDSIDWVAGVWYMDDDLDSTVFIDIILPPTGAAVSNIFTTFKQQTESLAFFGQATYNFTDNIRGTLGLRYSDETKSYNQTINLFGPPTIGLKTDESYDDLSPKVGIDWNATDEVLLYASYTEGFKAGGANVSKPAQTYDPETLEAIEIGTKTEWLDGRMQANLNYYNYSYKGFQSSLIDPNSPLADISNAADAELEGIETEFVYKPTDGLTINLNVAFADSEFLEYLSPVQFGGPPGSPTLIDLAGNQLPLTAEVSGNLAVSYEFSTQGATVSLSADHSFSSSSYLDNYNQSFTEQESYGITNARIGYTFEDGSLEGLQISAYVKNIQDEDILERADASGLNGGARIGYQKPRTFGAEARYNF